jgi:hypothetical protein
MPQELVDAMAGMKEQEALGLANNLCKQWIGA